MTHIGAAEQTAMRGLLSTLSETLSAPLAPEWERAFRAAPRHAFPPAKVWVGDELTTCTRPASPSSVRGVPRAWLEQTRPGGVILTPWETPWFCYGLLKLTVDGDGLASGRFSPYSAFTLMRNQRTDLRIYRDVVRDEHAPAESVTRLSPWTVTGSDRAVQFAIGTTCSTLSSVPSRA